MKITPEEIQNLLKDIEPIRVMNQAVANDTMGCYVFDSYIEEQSRSWAVKRLFQVFVSIAALMHIYSKYSESKDLSELFPMLLFLATAFGILYGGSRIIEPYLGGTNLFFLNETQRSLRDLNRMRKSINDWFNPAEIAQKAIEFNIGNCHEKCCIAFTHLLNKKEKLKGLFITQLGLDSVSLTDRKQDHSLLVISEKPLTLKKSDIFIDWAKKQKNDIIVLDPWKNTVCYGRDSQTDPKYFFEQKDFEQRVDSPKATVPHKDTFIAGRRR